MFHMHGCGERRGGRFAMRGHWGHGGGAPWAGRGEGRRRRMFDGTELRLVLLKLIADQPRHGYDLIRDIEERTAGAYAPSAGVIYPTLTMLDDMGLIAEEKAEGTRKLFSATDAGRTELDTRAEEVVALFKRLEGLGAERARVDRTPLRRAMGNLESVLRDRVGRGDIAAATVHEIVSLLDETAQKIERL
ncbi:PadR family transcriptional regulator [Allosphingosinicella deserti]